LFAGLLLLFAIVTRHMSFDGHVPVWSPVSLCE